LAKSLTVPKPPQVDQPSPASLPELRRKVIDAKLTVGRLRRSGGGGAELLSARVLLAVTRLNTVRLVRVFQLYLQRRGPLMAAGLAYRLFFAIAALLVVGFATLGIVIAGNEGLQSVVIDAVGRTVPGLIGDRSEGEGVIERDSLFAETRGLGFTLVVSVIVMLFTALSWVGGMRQAMRGMFALDPVFANPLLLRLKDLGTLALLAVVMLVTTALGIIANNTLGALLAFLNLSGVTQMLTQAAGFAVMIILDTLVAMVLLHHASAIDMPRKILRQGAVIAGLGSSLLRTFSAQILGSLGNNPLLVPFAVILALFIWFFLLSQVYMLATAWCAIGAADAEGQTERDHLGKAGTLKQRSRRGASD